MYKSSHLHTYRYDTVFYVSTVFKLSISVFSMCMCVHVLLILCPLFGIMNNNNNRLLLRAEFHACVVW